MLARTARNLRVHGVAFFRGVHDVAPLPFFSLQDELLLQDVKKEDFHAAWPDLYQNVEMDKRGFAGLSTLFLGRYVGKFSVKIGHKRLWTPMLVDTGAPHSFICAESFDKFGVTPGRAAVSIEVGSKTLTVKVSPMNSHFEEINLLGVDFLDKMPSFRSDLEKDISEGCSLEPTVDAYAALPSATPVLEFLRMAGGVERGMSDDEIQQVLLKLQSLRIRTVAGLRDLATAQLESLGFPLGVVALLSRVKGC